MKWAEIELEVHPSFTEAAEAVLTEAGCAGVVVHDPNAVSSDPFADWIVRDQEPRPQPDAPAAVRGYLPVDDRLEAALEDIQHRLTLLREADLDVNEEITLRTVDDAAWADAWKTYFKPQRIGQHFVVKPTWEAWEGQPEDRIIEIDPGMAFGSGSHPTTRLCLTVLEEVVQPGQRILDWGTGSGILAIGAARLGAAEITAVDLDPVAVKVTRENIAQNRLEAVIQAAEGSIEAVAAEPPYDLVIANIVADPIIAGAPEIYRHLRPGGQAVVSGIIDRREAEVTAALEAAGLRLQDVAREEDWRALLLERPE